MKKGIRRKGGCQINKVFAEVLLPGVVEGHGAVLQLLAHDLHLLVVLLAIGPVLLVVDAVAGCALELLHRVAVYGVVEGAGEVARVVGSEHPLQHLRVAVVHGLHADGDLSATETT